MKRAGALRLSLGGLLALAMAGCPHRATEVRFGPGGEITDPQKLIELLDHRQGAFTSLIGDARLHIDSTQGNGTLKQFVAVARPASLHIESFDFFGRPVSVLVSDGTRFSLYDADKGEFYRGPATPEAIEQFLPVAIAPEEIASLMLGDVPRIAGTSARLSVDTERGRYLLQLAKEESNQTLELATDDDRVLRSTVSGSEGYTLVLDDYRPAPDGSAFPYRVELTRPPRLELKYRYTDIKLNTALDPALFHQAPPPGSKLIELDARGIPISSPKP